MPRPRLNLLVVTFLAVASISLHAQVVKCHDPRAGKTTYTDGFCAGTERSSEVARRQTPEEVAAERRQAAIAQQRVRQEIADLQARKEQAVSAAQQRQYSDPPAVDKTRTVECERAKRNLKLEQNSITKQPNLAAALVDIETACGIDASKYLPAARSRHRDREGAPRPSIITSCDAGGCWDNLGGRYNGSGSTLFSTDGRACRKIGTQLICN